MSARLSIGRKGTRKILMSTAKRSRDVGACYKWRHDRKRTHSTLCGGCFLCRCRIFETDTLESIARAPSAAANREGLPHWNGSAGTLGMVRDGEPALNRGVSARPAIGPARTAQI